MSLYPSYMFVSSRRYVLEVVPDTTLPRDKFFVRVLHELELSDGLPHTTPPGRPEVRPFFPNHFSPFDRSWQLLAWGLNPHCSAGNMTAVYDTHLWIANDHGTGNDNKPVANYFENKNLSRDPIAVEALTCAGNLLSVIGEIKAKTNAGIEDCYAVESLNWHSPVALDWLEARPWLITHAVNMGRDGTPRRFEMGTQPNGFIPGIRHPFVTGGGTIAIPKWRCVRWTEPNAPDPYKVYL